MPDTTRMFVPGSRLGLAALLATAALATVAPAIGVAGSPAATAPASRVCDGLPATILGTAGDDDLRGTPGRDVIAAGAGNDRIWGLGGDDVLCGEAGADNLYGGIGSDRLFGGVDGVMPGNNYTAGDYLVPGAGDDHVDPGPYQPDTDDPDILAFRGASDGLVVDLAAGTARGQGRDRLVGPPVRNLEGSVGPDRIYGTSGAETIYGGGGRDVIDGREGDDHLVDGTSLLRADHVADELIGGPGNDWMQISGGADKVKGGPGDDRLTGGGPAAVLFYAGRGDDVAYVGSSRAPQRLFGGPGDDILGAGHAADHVYGADGDDRVSGGEGNDEIDGGSGYDEGDAGSGRDRCLGTEAVTSCEVGP